MSNSASVKKLTDHLEHQAHSSRITFYSKVLKRDVFRQVSKLK